MARPTTRTELLTAATERYDALAALIAGMSEAEREADLFYGDGFDKPEAHWERDRNLRDVLVHLTAWHGLLIDWVEANERGEAGPFLPAPYTWRDYAGMNVGFRDAHADTTTEVARAELGDSHRAVVALIERFDDDELFVKKYFPWTGTTSLGAYCVSATSSHYDWAAKKLRAARKAARGSN
ncbi:ClbS/DfsB family four-helix bundle protein [Leucobacter aridicollis]|uniref:ClbS/DfsB family four-helix bundle protein n=1 Tax=Leucobacter aridicollis TaxID=283878 RepID=A0A852RH50_9MICO|nr:ClbS/DfsB family four-helix bundle protein [Leucobacter aridicollis]MBL3680815.1 DfsB family protein [Leucobacter aridicollis]NYD28180.1 hypothetical protein [Leucobacter aridicollis]